MESYSGKNPHILSLKAFKRDYFKLLSDKKIKHVFPTLNYKKSRGFYELNLDITRAEHFTAEFGGNISSNASSTAFLGLQYNLLNRLGFAIIANGYFGRFYSSANAEFRVDFPGNLPLFAKADIHTTIKIILKTPYIFLKIRTPHSLSRTKIISMCSWVCHFSQTGCSA